MRWSHTELLISREKKRKRRKGAAQPFCILNGLWAASAWESASLPQGQVMLLHTSLLHPGRKNRNQVNLGPFQGWFFFQPFWQSGEVPLKIQVQWLSKWAATTGFWGEFHWDFSSVCALCASPGSEALPRAEVSTGRCVQLCCTDLCPGSPGLSGGAQKCPRLDFERHFIPHRQADSVLNFQGDLPNRPRCLCSLAGVEQFGGKCGF